MKGTWIASKLLLLECPSSSEEGSTTEPFVPSFVHFETWANDDDDKGRLQCCKPSTVIILTPSRLPKGTRQEGTDEHLQNCERVTPAIKAQQKEERWTKKGVRQRGAIATIHKRVGSRIMFPKSDSANTAASFSTTSLTSCQPNGTAPQKSKKRRCRTELCPSLHNFYSSIECKHYVWGRHNYWIWEQLNYTLKVRCSRHGKWSECCGVCHV